MAVSSSPSVAENQENSVSTFGRTSDQRDFQQRKLVGVVLACGAVAALGIGLAAPANAATLGKITNYAPGYVFKSERPSRQEVSNTIWRTAWEACRRDHRATRSVELVSYTQFSNRGQVTSTWNCRNTP